MKIWHIVGCTVAFLVFAIPLGMLQPPKFVAGLLGEVLYALDSMLAPSQARQMEVHLWDPLGFFWTVVSIGGLSTLALTGAVLLSLIGFVCFWIWKRWEQFFSPPLFLALAPFIGCSLISYLRFYTIMGSAPPGDTVADGAPFIVTIQYPIQFGMVSSGILFLLHSAFVATLAIRRRRVVDSAAEVLVSED